MPSLVLLASQWEPSTVSSKSWPRDQTTWLKLLVLLELSRMKIDLGDLLPLLLPQLAVAVAQYLTPDVTKFSTQRTAPAFLMNLKLNHLFLVVATHSIKPVLLLSSAATRSKFSRRPLLTPSLPLMSHPAAHAKMPSIRLVLTPLRSESSASMVTSVSLNAFNMLRMDALKKLPEDPAKRVAFTLRLPVTVVSVVVQVTAPTSLSQYAPQETSTSNECDRAIPIVFATARDLINR